MDLGDQSSFADSSISSNTKKEKYKMDFNNIMLLLFGIAIVVFTFRKSNKESRDKKDMKTLASATKDVADASELVLKDVKKLSELNKDLSERAEKMADENLSLSKENQDMLRQHAEILTATKALTEELRESNLHEAKQKAIEGELVAAQIDQYRLANRISIMLGDEDWGGNAADFIHGAGKLNVNNPRNIFPISAKVRVVDRRILLSGEIKDLEGRTLVTFVDNNWTRNAASTYQFNYTDNAFEIYDLAGNLAFSVKFTKADTVHIQGYLHTKEGLKVLTPLQNFNYEGSKEDCVQQFRSDLRYVHQKPLFMYTGADYLGKPAVPYQDYYTLKPFRVQMNLCGQDRTVVFEPSSDHHSNRYRASTIDSVGNHEMWEGSKSLSTNKWRVDIGTTDCFKGKESEVFDLIKKYNNLDEIRR